MGWGVIRKKSSNTPVMERTAGERKILALQKNGGGGKERGGDLVLLVGPRKGPKRLGRGSPKGRKFSTNHNEERKTEINHRWLAPSC